MLGPGEELVRVQAGGLNFADTMTAYGGYPGTPKPPLVAGREFCGTRASNGERVMGYTQWGAFAELVAARSALLWPVPASWSAEEGAAFPVNFFTAYFAYWKAGLLDDSAKGARVLIHAVAGGVGTAAVQIGKICSAWRCTAHPHRDGKARAHEAYGPATRNQLQEAGLRASR